MATLTIGGHAAAEDVVRRGLASHPVKSERFIAAARLEFRAEVIHYERAQAGLGATGACTEKRCHCVEWVWARSTIR